MTNSVNVKAEGLSYTLPYNYEDYSANQTLFPDDFYLTVLSDYLSSNPVSWGGNLGSDYIIIPSSRDGNDIYVYVFSDFEIVGDTSSIASIYSNSITLKTLSDKTNLRMSYRVGSDGSLTFKSVNNAYYANTTISIFGGQDRQEFMSTGLYFQRYYPCYVSSDVYDNYNNLVLAVTPGAWNEQEAFEDFQYGLDIISTIANNIDPALSDLQNQKGFFDNLINNLSNFFNKLNGWINNAFSFLASNIKNFFGPFLRNIQNRINTFFESFEDFKDKWNHFFEVLEFCYRLGVVNGEFNLGEFLSALFVPSSSDIDNAFTGHSINTLYHGTVNASKTYYNFFTTVFSGNYVYIFSLPNFSFGGKEFQGLEVNFSWFLQYKSYCDIIISAFLIIAYIRFLLTFVNNFFYGSGFIDHDLNTIGGEKGIDYTIPY